MILNKFGAPILQSDDQIMIVRVALNYCWLPNPEVVSELKDAIFPVVRDTKRRGEEEFVEKLDTAQQRPHIVGLPRPERKHATLGGLLRLSETFH